MFIQGNFALQFAADHFWLTLRRWPAAARISGQGINVSSYLVILPVLIEPNIGGFRIRLPFEGLLSHLVPFLLNLLQFPGLSALQSF